MSIAEPLAEWAIVEIMGHRSFAGWVTEKIIAGKGFIRIDVPESTTFDNKVQPAFTKIFGTDAIYGISPCSEKAARDWTRNLGSRAIEGSKLLLPPNPIPLSGGVIENCAPHDTESIADGLVCLDEAHVLTPADVEMFAKLLGVDSITNDDDVGPIINPDDGGGTLPTEDLVFVDPIDNQPF